MKCFDYLVCGIACLNRGTPTNDCTACQCSLRYSGLFCEEEINYCTESNCGLHGSCVNDYEAMSYKCSCNQGWEGSVCSQCTITNCEECTGDPPVCVRCENNYIVSSSGIIYILNPKI